MVSEATQSYLEYLHHLGWKLDDSIRQRLDHICVETDWDNPTTGQDLNNAGVAALIQAQDCDDLSMKASLMELAQEAFSEGKDSHPLCKAHGALLNVMTGRFDDARQQTFTELLQIQVMLEKDNSSVPLGLIYFPLFWYARSIDRAQVMEVLYSLSQNGLEQAYQYLNQVFIRSAQIFYNSTGLKTLAISAQIAPDLSIVQLKHGIACLITQQFEGLVYLHTARRLNPTNATVLQSLCLAYRDIGQNAIAHHYWTESKQHLQGSPDLAGVWTQTDPDAVFTYVPFDQGVTLTVQPSLSSIVTSVLLAEGDWFESEMEFWRSWLKPGMTAIDVGANAGVYTFSAATRVGSAGKVIAIEPFPVCVSYLKETCRINQFNWVRVYGAAASDRMGKTRLLIQEASELNEVITDEQVALSIEQYIEVPCLTLDSLIEQEEIESVDFIKLDAEGHEIKVLLGSKRLLADFSPIILYENIAREQKNNVEVAEFLIQQDYQLYTYQPYLSQLIPVKSVNELDGQLNIVAIPKHKKQDFFGKF
jgi:FkbM family methyltransferase